MYLDHFGLSEAPFRITPHTDFFFAGANRGATLEALIYAIMNDEGIVKVDGEVGSGKTMLCRVLMEKLPANVVIVYLANPSLSRDDIVFAIGEELGLALPEHSRVSPAIRALQNRLIELHGEGRRVVVLIDEAHAMPMETLEEIRLLSNLETSRHKLLQLVLFGQPELDGILARADMRQLRERITHHFTLEPLRQDDIVRYIDFRMRAAGYRGPLPFTDNAIKLVAEASQGLTRRINILAEKSLLAAYAEGLHQITPKHVDAAVRDSRYDEPGRMKRHRIALLAGSVGILAILTAALWAVTPRP
jgi:type II secretory pathway predicted ATPase ExeA